MKWNTILFDLDGTLTDPGVGITKAVAHALEAFGIPVEDRSSLTHFIGPPLQEEFMTCCGFSEQQAYDAVEKFREYYNVTGWLENEPYPKMRELLEELRSAGKTLVVATSKPEETARRVLTHFGMDCYFSEICGAPMHGPDATRKVSVIRDAFRRVGIQNLSEAIMVGDRRHDILGGHEAGLQAIGVLYGYGSREELSAAGADYIAEDVSALRSLLLVGDRKNDHEAPAK